MSDWGQYRPTYAGISDFKSLEQWAKMVPDAPRRAWEEMDRQANYVRRRGWVLIFCAVTMSVGSTVVTVILALKNLTVPAAVQGAAVNAVAFRLLTLAQHPAVGSAMQVGQMRLPTKRAQRTTPTESSGEPTLPS